jgi:transposase
MRNGLKLKEYEEITIADMKKYHHVARVRERAQAIELLNTGISRNEVSKILNKHEDTISDWTVNYKKFGIVGLLDKKRSGRPRKVTDEIKNKIMEITESEETCSINSINEYVEQEFGVRFHPNTIKYHLKKIRLCIKQMQRIALLIVIIFCFSLMFPSPIGPA